MNKSSPRKSFQRRSTQSQKHPLRWKHPSKLNQPPHRPRRRRWTRYLSPISRAPTTFPCRRSPFQPYSPYRWNLHHFARRNRSPCAPPREQTSSTWRGGCSRMFLQVLTSIRFENFMAKKTPSQKKTPQRMSYTPAQRTHHTPAQRASYTPILRPVAPLTRATLQRAMEEIDSQDISLEEKIEAHTQLRNQAK